MITHVTVIAGTYKPQRCGVAHYTERLRTVLREQDVESVVLTTYDAAQAVCDRNVRGVVSGWGISSLVPLVRSLQAIPTDILHIQHAAGTYNFERAIFLLPLLLRILGWRKPIVTTIHEYGWWEWQPSFFPPQLLEWIKTWGQQREVWDREDGFLLTGSDAIITTNGEAEKVIYTRLPSIGDRLYSVPIAANIEVATIDKDLARQSLRFDCNWSYDVSVFVFFGFLHPVKGLENLLQAFKQVLSVHPQSRLLLLGGVESLALSGEQASKYWDKLHKLVSDLNLDQFVRITGYLPADTASKYIAGADVGVLPFNCGVTTKSGSLLTILAHGLPCVVTRHDPPSPDLTDDIVRLVTRRDINGIATALIELSSDAQERVKLGDAGRSFVHKFSWDAIAQSHLKVYQTCLSSSHH